MDGNTAGKITSETDEDNAVQGYEYEPAYGRLSRINGADANYITFGYDDQGNVRLKQYWDNASATITRASSWDYNHPDYPGLLWKEYLSDGTTSTQYTYDAGGRPGLGLDFNGKQTAYGYDAFDRVRSSAPDGAPATVFDYDRQGNLSAVTDPVGQSDPVCL